MAERQTNYTIGECAELPSKGLIYGSQVPSQVELRSMTARDEMKRLAPSNSQFKVLADIIEGCMIEKFPIHVYDLALGDYEYLLHRLRIATYGDEYRMSLRCPYCGEYIDAVAHLEQLQLKEFDYEAFKEASTITLPRSGCVITLNYQTPRILDSTDIKVKDMKRRFKDAEVDFNLMVMLSNSIDTVDGIHLDEVKLESFVNKLPALDMTKILNAIECLNGMVGLDNSIIVDCNKCGGEVPTSFRFGPEFFRPTTI
jgi:hypothetical protein